MKIYGLTGMSGAGKTTVCQLFSENGFEVINCDEIARAAVRKGAPCLELIAKRLGEDLILPDGNLDRKKIFWQAGELGKVDQGGGGTVAMFLAQLNMDVVDIGVPLLSMHSPFEIASKVDVFENYRAIGAFFGC